MRYGDSRASALWGKGEGRWRRRIVCLTAVAALCAPSSALAGPKGNDPAVDLQIASAAEVAEPVAVAEPVFAWFANWTW
jgi:hypothetical protein